MREQVERDEPRRRLLREHLDPRRGRVDALAERVEELAAVGAVDDDLAVEHDARVGERELREVARQRTAVARLQVHVAAVDERDRAEAVPLRLVGPALALGQLGPRARELGWDRGRQGQAHGWRRLRFRRGGQERVHDARGRPGARSGSRTRARSTSPSPAGRSSTSPSTTSTVADAALVHLRERPTVMKRFVNGIMEEPIWQKRVPKNVPDWLQTATVAFPSGRTAEELVANDAAHLVWAVNLGVIDFNPWPARRADLDHPDELRVDLDPTPGVGWDDVRQHRDGRARRARRARPARLPEDVGLARASTSTCGSSREWDFLEVRRAALALAREVERRAPDLATSKWWKEERHGVFVDYNQNARDRTVASCYSVRPTPDARVSCALRVGRGRPTSSPATCALDTVPGAPARRAATRRPTSTTQPGSLDAAARPRAAATRRAGLGDAPWPPHFPKQTRRAQARAAEPRPRPPDAPRPRRRPAARRPAARRAHRRARSAASAPSRAPARATSTSSMTTDHDDTGQRASRSPTSPSCPSASRACSAPARERIGFVPNVFRACAFRPERLSAWFAHFRLLHEAHAGPERRRARDDRGRRLDGQRLPLLPRRARRGAARGAGRPDHGRPDHARLAPRGRPRRAPARDLRASPRSSRCARVECERGGPRALRAHGLSDEDAWDVIEIASMYNFTNRLALATGQLPNPEYHAMSR